ncbi:phage immunity repressor protein [Yersinia pekkanenii]|uniref:Phage immunity repressor protein n=1 Tax=Yersinia pekkanenii TaxID=1288385 RepID=A0A0T9RTM9_9GAMM|nr:host cell division inhibitor Icd-like protein [Yersinia pekkanenii]CNI81961.1 phage immunity repressor protein [Yersinia pekkanenii]
MNNLSNRVSSALATIPDEHQSLALDNIHYLSKVKVDYILTVFIFATVKRSDVKAKPVMRRVTASSYNEARQQLIGDYVISFAGKVPFREVNHG